MVTVQPELGDVGELAVVRDGGGVQVGVVVNDRLVFGVVMEERLRLGSGQQKVVVDKHGREEFDGYTPE